MVESANGLMPGAVSLADDKATVTAMRRFGSSCFAPGGAPAPEDDPVNHPSHYTQGGVECIDAIDAAVSGLPADEAVCAANVIKYVWRYRHKSPVESLKKARWYLDRLIGKMETRYSDNVDVQHRI